MPALLRSCLCAAALQAALMASCHAAADPSEASAEVNVWALRNPVDKSYRRMIAGMDLFEKRHALAPDAPLRFKLLPRRRDTRMASVEVAIVGDSFELPVAVAADRTFTLARHRAALKENASVRPNRKKQTMTWRAEIRTPGLPPNTRRLGDLRLECEVGMEAGLISNARPGLFSLMRNLLEDGPEYCRQSNPRYLFFAERPLFGVALVDGARREVLPVDSLYASASRYPEWRDELSYCDCEVLLDRAYFVPLGDPSWPDDTLVELEYLEDAKEAVVIRESTKTDVRAVLGEATVVGFDSGYEVWVYRETLPEKKPPPPTEFVLLFAPTGILAKTRVR